MLWMPVTVLLHLVLPKIFCKLINSALSQECKPQLLQQVLLLQSKPIAPYSLCPSLSKRFWCLLGYKWASFVLNWSIHFAIIIISWINVSLVESYNLKNATCIYPWKLNFFPSSWISPLLFSSRTASKPTQAALASSVDGHYTLQKLDKMLDIAITRISKRHSYIFSHLWITVIHGFYVLAI